MKFSAVFLLLSLFSLNARADSTSAFKIYGKTTSVLDVAKENQGEFFDLEKKKYELIERLAQEQFFKAYWEKVAKDKNTTPEKAKNDFMTAASKVSDSKVKETLGKFKDHPQLSKLPPDEQKKQIREYLEGTAGNEAMQGLITKARKSGELVVLYSEPVEPTYEVPLNAGDVVKYGPSADDISPSGCKGEECPITVVEYSEFECPFCSRVIPDAKKILAEYKGKIRWVVRDYPLPFHARARPAAIAAKCSAAQGKYWNMYEKLFENQQNLGDEDFVKHAKAINLNMDKFNKCVKEPGDILAKIKENIDSGSKLGVNGTPAYFINGVRLSGALPYSEFKRVIDVALAKKR